MGYKTIDTKLWVKWLKFKGLEYKRSKGDHDIWDHPTKPYPRPIVFRGGKKQIPGCHIYTCLKTMNISQNTFYQEIAEL